MLLTNDYPPHTKKLKTGRSLKIRGFRDMLECAICFAVQQRKLKKTRVL